MKTRSNIYPNINFILFLAAVMALGPASAPSVFAAGGIWNVDAAGNWNDTANWSPAAVPGTAAGDVVGLNFNLTAARIVTLDAAATVGTLNLGDPTSGYFGYTLPGSSTLTFNNSGSQAYLRQVSVGGANDTLSVPITLADNLTIYNVNGLTNTGVISGSGKGVTKDGAGMLTLTENNGYTGPTTVNRGTLNIGGSTADGSISFSSALSLGGGTVNYTRTGGVAQDFNGVTLTGGASAIQNTVNTSGHTMALGAITRTAGSGAMVDFTTNANAIITTTTEIANGILGGWATVGNSSTNNWATTNASGQIVSYTAYTAGAPSGSTVNNYQGSGTVGSTATANSFFMTADSSVSSGATLSLISGGFICNVGSGVSKWMRNNGAASTTGTGQITGPTNASGGELFMNVFSGTDWSFWPAFVNNAAGGAITLVKGGAGTLRLRNINTYTGGTVVNAGTLQLDNGGSTACIRGSLTINPGATANLALANALGYNSTSDTVTNVTINGGTLNNTTSGDQGYYTTFNLTGGTMANSGYYIFGSGADCGIKSFASPLVSTISGAIYLKGDVVNLPITTEAGTVPGGIDLDISAVITAGTSGKGIIKSGAGYLRLSSRDTLSGATTVNGGTLEVSGYNGMTNSSSFSVNSNATLKLNGLNLFTVGHYAAMGNTRVITVDNATLLMDTNFESRFGNVTLKNGSTWTCNRALTGYDALLANTDAGAATVLVTNTLGTAASIMDGTGGIHLQGVQNFDVADVTGDSTSDLNVSMILSTQGSQGGTAGGINKLGLGTMTLSAANTYAGNTVINQGTLALGSMGSFAFTPVISLASNAVLDVTAKSGGLALGAQSLYGGGTVLGSLNDGTNSLLAAGPRIYTPGTLSLTGDLTLNGRGTLACDIASISTPGSGINDLINVAGNVNLTGVTVLRFNFLGGAPATNVPYLLLTNLGARVGGASNFVVTPDGYATVLDDSNPHALYVTFTAPPTYTPPASSRADVNLDSGWRFIRQDTNGAQNVSFDDSGWTNLDLPHTWNNLDGQDGGTNYYRGVGWYRRHYTLDGSLTNRHFFLKFDGANIVSDVYINGNFVGQHQGGFAAFVYDVTTNLNLGADNVIAVKVNNAANSDVAPLSADFTFFGGIYRDVHLLVTDPVHVSPLDHGSPGVYLKPTNVSSNSAELQLTTLVSNANPTAASVIVRAVITDAATNLVATLTNVISLPASSLSNVVASAVILNPHLWNGLADPYLYHAFVEIYHGTNLTDLVRQPLGFRFFSVDPNNGFFLNGRYYDLYGVNLHQDWLNCGWALNNAQRETNFMLLKELGVTAYRMAHYQKTDYEYQLADRNGIILWSEIPLVNGVTESTAFYNNAKQQLREMIRQNYNHPAVVCWGMYNELPLGLSTALVGQLVQLAAQEDPTRLSTAATHSTSGDANSWTPQIVAFNKYFGWYVGPLNGIGSWADTLHAAHPNNCIGIAEYGAGASIYQHSEDPVSWPTTDGPYHPEEWQNLVHETNWPLIKARPFLWCKFIWNMFDFAVDSRDEGDTSGRNDKGLVTYDRLTRKDVFYYYQANWTTNPMVHVTGHTFTNRLTNAVTAKVYANCDSVELFVNGVSQGSRTNASFVFTWPVALATGSNYVQAVGSKGGSNVTDSLAWFLPFRVAITNPQSSVVWLNSTNDTLQIAAVISNSANPFLINWLQNSGPGPVVFGNGNALATTARFGAAGVYGVSVTAAAGNLNSSASLTVVVGTNDMVADGLNAWWKMDETTGPTAVDSSANGRDATVTNTSFTTGHLANALQLDGSTNSYGYFSAADGNQVTLAAWVKASGNGGASFPRILDVPSYRFYFRFTSTDSSSVGFATYDGTNGDYDSGANTISQGVWYHVAVSYDRNNLSTPPIFYINGRKMTTSVLASPSGTPPPFTGPGYIGNRSDGTRGWDGLIDDLRIYNRILNVAEVQALAAMPRTNLAPAVNAGTNQTVVWPASANLNGAVSDDGNPNPPGTLMVAWSQTGGPGSVTFANANAAITTASFSAAGTYALRLTASDGQVTTSSDVAVNVISRSVLVWQRLSDQLQLSWDDSGVNWRLQVQTNSAATGLGTNWVDLPQSSGTVVDLDTTPGSVFYRLIYP